MLKVMARENGEEWASSATVDQETVMSVVLAYAEGKIELESLPVMGSKAGIRYAPGFHRKDIAPAQVRSEKPYTATAIADFDGSFVRRRSAPDAGTAVIAI